MALRSSTAAGQHAACLGLMLVLLTIRRLIKHEQVRLAEERTCERDAHAPATTEGCERREVSVARHCG
jgi:hypothetical protein